MRIFATEQEVEKAVDLLVDKYRVSTQMLNQMLSIGKQAKDILSGLDGTQLTKRDVARLLVLRYGPGLFGGTKQRKLRQKLLQGLPDDAINSLYEADPSNSRTVTDTARRRTKLADKKWHPGKTWPKDFVNALGFPRIFAGVCQTKSPDTVEIVHPRTSIPELVDFQRTLKAEVLALLRQEKERGRCIVTLPTGGGKTRVAVEVSIEWMAECSEGFSEGQYLVWIAQSEELCDQAIAHIKQMWENSSRGSSLQVYRYFGNRDIKQEALDGGAVVASINKLHERIKAGDPILAEILSNTGIMVIDEAHRAVSKMYDALIDKASQLTTGRLFPILGLTATPGRAGIYGENETEKLVERFNFKLIRPELGIGYDDDNSLEYFREHEFLVPFPRN